VRYWHRRIFHPGYARAGELHHLPEWAIKVQHAGRRESFSSGIPNKAAAAEKSRGGTTPPLIDGAPEGPAARS